MAECAPVARVKLIVAVWWSDDAARTAASARLIERWGPLDHSGVDHAFDETAYYAREMGTRLHKRLVSFTELVSPGVIAPAKLWCNDLENQLAGPTGRRVNLDIGYLDHSKLVLASVKYAGQKIYLSDGIYADPVARYRGGRYEPFEWTFPDFKDGRYDADLAAIRAAYLAQRKSG